MTIMNDLSRNLALGYKGIIRLGERDDLMCIGFEPCLNSEDMSKIMSVDPKPYSIERHDNNTMDISYDGENFEDDEHLKRHAHTLAQMVKYAIYDQIHFLEPGSVIDQTSLGDDYYINVD